MQVVTVMRPFHRGFTLIELIVSIAILAILLSLAAPAFTSFIASQRLKTAASNLQSFLLTARSEALKRNANVTLAPIQAGQWNTGWTIKDSAGTVLFSSDPVTNSTINGPGSVVYRSTGRLQSPISTFKLSSTKTSEIRCIEIDLSGIPRVSASGC